MKIPDGARVMMRPGHGLTTGELSNEHTLFGTVFATQGSIVYVYVEHQDDRTQCIPCRVRQELVTLLPIPEKR